MKRLAHLGTKFLAGFSWCPLNKTVTTFRDHTYFTTCSPQVSCTTMTTIMCTAIIQHKSEQTLLIILCFSTTGRRHATDTKKGPDMSSDFGSCYDQSGMRPVPKPPVLLEQLQQQLAQWRSWVHHCNSELRNNREQKLGYWKTMERESEREGTSDDNSPLSNSPLVELRK